jgi:hypothetical protein
VTGDDPVDVMRAHMNRLRGRLFQAVEATGVPEKQQVAIKGLIRNLTYDAQADLEALLKEKADARHAV